MTVRNRPFGALGILLIATLASTAGAKGKEDETKPGGAVAAEKRADPAKPAQPATAGKPAQPAEPASAAQKAPGQAEGKDKGKDAKGEPAGNSPPHARSQEGHPEKGNKHEGEKKGHDGKGHEGHEGKGLEGHEGKGHGKDDPDAPGGKAGHGHGKHFGSAVRDLRDRFKEGKLSKDELKAQLKALNDDRKQRRERHRKQLEERWGQRLAAPAAAAELRHHSRRMAHLNRMLLVAETEKKGADKDKLVARIEKLTELETQRHERKMNQIEAPVAAQ
jgi:hypothetical protein